MRCRALHAEIDRSRSLDSRVKRLEVENERYEVTLRLLGSAFVRAVPDRRRALAVLEDAGAQPKTAQNLHEQIIEHVRSTDHSPSNGRDAARTPEPARAAPRGR